MMKFIIRIFINSVAVLLASIVLSGGVHIGNYGYAILVALTLAILNVSVKPLLVLFTLPATILSLGLFMLVINTVIIEIAAHLLDPYFKVDSWGYAFIFSILLSVLNSILDNLTKLPSNTGTREDAVKIYDRDGRRIG